MPTRTEFLDTNVLVNLVSGEPAKAAQSRALLKAGGVVSVQVLNEFTAVATRKLLMPFADIRDILWSVRIACALVPLDTETHDLGLDIAERHRLGVYDAMILAAARQAGCTTLLTEDMSEGQVVEGVTIRDPFRGLS